MNPKNTQQLFQDYPDIFQQKDLPMTQSLMCFGFECGDGWFDLIDTLCNKIKNAVEYHNENVDRFKDKEDRPEWAPTAYISVQAVQVKEKYGGLRFYVDGNNDYIRGLISMAESMSYKICEECGAPGKPNDRGWISTLCDRHREERKQFFTKSLQNSLQLKLPFFEEGSDE